MASPNGRNVPELISREGALRMSGAESRRVGPPRPGLVHCT